MKFSISAKGIKRLTISSGVGAGGGAAEDVSLKIPSKPASGRRITARTAIPAALVLGTLLPFLFVRIAIFVLESASVRSSFDCGGWRFFSGADRSLKLRDELTRALMEANEGNDDIGAESFNELVKEFTSKQDLKTFAFKTKAMLLQMERKAQLAKQQESVYWHLASQVRNSANPEKLVFHIVTNKETYTPMHAWFSTNSIESAVVEVRGLHQYDWSAEVNADIKDMLDINHLIWKHYHSKEKDLNYSQDHNRYLDTLRPSSRSLMNHLIIYLPKLFPDLKKIVFLDDDVVVQQDISSLWELNLNGKVSGSVFRSWCGNGCCSAGTKYMDYLNFSHPLISSSFNGDRYTWLYGMNIFDLEAWRNTNITEIYHHWLKLNLKSGLELWNPGLLPPALIAFEGQVHSINSSMLVTDLGHRHRSGEISRERVEAAAVIHFAGPAKPWLEISFPEVRSLWSRYVNFSNKFTRRCGIITG
ncbi:probable galacturonosyltransferase 15 isoform X4 [Arachis stenosperma]|uniref:probable galacturonosyltransferase 15 isoform X4 n=1 Tax=Arachis stenosperma TaxID=217475 RepID=UPI0025ABB382|nr:probable galacturonosyltransferase 15 isoform X4 [Arachis stenosperma]